MKINNVQIVLKIKLLHIQHTWNLVINPSLMLSMFNFTMIVTVRQFPVEKSSKQSQSLKNKFVPVYRTRHSNLKQPGFKRNYSTRISHDNNESNQEEMSNFPSA